ncbi:PKD domain-containing protein [Rhodohalobacter sp.]|uniref:PKD domain-containing protein n=1 Tax=Rhodohalobacter sp. TaxID=1974210 RepID=UPI003569672D
MKTLIKIQWMLPVLLIIGLGLGACEPQVSSDPNLDEPPKSENVTFDYTHNPDNPNIVEFVNTSNSFKALWDFGNGAKAEGDVVTGRFPLQGEYTVQLTIFTESGQAVNSQIVTIEETNPIMLDDPDLNMLTGGADQIEGKTWVIDSTQVAHMGVGPPDGDWPEYWQAPPLAKPGTGLYTDEYTFTLDGFNFEMQTSGYVFLNGAYGDEVDGTYEAPGGDLMAQWTAPNDLSFNFIKNEDDGDMFITVSDPGWIGFFAGTREYEILEISENRLALRFEDSNNDLAWYHTLIPKGYEHPTEEIPYESNELFDNFDEDGNVTWVTEEVTGFNENYDNPAPVGINTSEKVARYVKGEAKFDNVFINLDYKMDLNVHNKVRLKVYFPSYNDYETEDPNAEAWAPSASLSQQVEVKLHDSQNPEPWVNQATVVQTVAETNTWVELEFDFSEWSAEEIYDKIIVQIGGEGHGMPGIFFIDDFQLIE